MTRPGWLPPFDDARAHSPADLMRLAIEVALANARQGGGPFGAIVADGEGHILGVGWNDVVASHDSTAHAEVVALRDAQRRRRTHRLDGCVLYASCAPCIQCYGAIYWSGVEAVYAAARKDDAEAIGFEEGPTTSGLWEQALAQKGIAYHPDFLRDERALEPLRVYAQRGGVNYSKT